MFLLYSTCSRSLGFSFTTISSFKKFSISPSLYFPLKTFKNISLTILKGTPLYIDILFSSLEFPNIEAFSFKNSFTAFLPNFFILYPSICSAINFISSPFFISIIELVHCSPPDGRRSIPKKAFIKVDFPLLASPVTSILNTLFLISSAFL